MKKKLILLIVLLLVVTMTPALSASGDDVVGLWLTDGGKSKVEIVREQDEYRGKIVWLKEEVYPEDDPEAGTVKYDRNNPDEKLRPRPILGLELVWGFRYDEKGHKWERGRIYDPESGKTYNCTMWLDEEGNLNVKGSLDKWGLIGRSTLWTPVKE
jgi:uncharacterized protein (DUF2147 family)